MKEGHAARREVRCLFSDVGLAKNPNVGTNGNRLWLKIVLRAVNCFNRSATKANAWWRLPYEVFFSRPPELQVVPVLQSGTIKVVGGT